MRSKLLKEIPMLSSELIKQLDECESKLNIRPGLNIDIIMFRSGRRSIIDELKIRQEWHNNKNNNPNKVEM